MNFVGFKIDFYKGLLAGTVLICSGFILLTVLNLTLIDLTYFSFYDQIFYFFLFTIVSLNEEIAIRGYILHNLSSSFNKYVALIISSLVFMIMHLGNPNIGILPLVNLFLAGIFLGIYTIHKNNLWFAPLSLCKTTTKSYKSLDEISVLYVSTKFDFLDPR